MDIIKISRHKKIIGDFGERILCNWLSRSGLEVIIVDHTGIDVIAYNPATEKRLGITIKSRTRTLGEEDSDVRLFSQKRNDREKLLNACKAFACEPYLAVYVETIDYADLFLTSLQNYDNKYRGTKVKVTDVWRMRWEDKEKYHNDSNVKHVRIRFDTAKWSW